MKTARSWAEPAIVAGSAAILLVWSVAWVIAATHKENAGHPSQIVIMSPNERFEIRLEATDDGCRILQVDTVGGHTAVMSVDIEDEAVIGIGEKKYLENGAFRCAMKTYKGFVEWNRPVELP